MSKVMLARLVSAACLFSVGLLTAQQAPDATATARKALDLFLNGKYSEMEDLFAPNLKEQMKLDALAKLGAQVKSWGTPEIGEPAVRAAGTTHIVVLPLKFPSQNINVQMGVNHSGELSGFIMLPATATWQHPSYSKTGAFQERTVTVGDDPYKLPGTLTLPSGKGPFPAVVLVHDTGLNDRDESVGAVKMFRDLAEGLASRGIAVPRYEKRSRVYRSRVTDKPYTANEDTIDDAVSAVELLRQQPEINGKRVFVLGHGLGGYLAPRIATAAKANGIIILASTERPLEDVIVEQATQMLGTPSPNDTPAAAAARTSELNGIKAAAAKVKTLEVADEDQPNMLGLPVAYWVDLKGYDPIAVAKKLSVPVLILAGDRDPQVSAQDFNLWKAGLASQKGASAKSYPGLNHSFVAGEGKSTDAEYRKPSHAAPEVIEDIANFVGQ